MQASEFQDRVQEMIRTIEDPVELHQELTALIETRFPVLRPFTPGETMPMHQFLARFQRTRCSCVPDFYQREVVIANDAPDGVLVLIKPEYKPEMPEAA